MSSVDKLVDGLHKVLVELLALLLLLGPVVRVGFGVDAEDVLVVLDEGLDGFDGELECDLVAEDHVDVYDVGFDVEELVVEEGLDEGIGVLAQLRLWRLGKHDGR